MLAAVMGAEFVRSGTSSHIGPALAAALVVATALPLAARGGGEGQGIPPPDFVPVCSNDPEKTCDTRADCGGVAPCDCVDSAAFCYDDETFVIDAINRPGPGVPRPRWVRKSDPQITCYDPQLSDERLVVDGPGSTDVCIPEFIDGCTMTGGIRITTSSSEGGVGSGEDTGTCAPTDPNIVERMVAATIELRINTADGPVGVQTVSIPSSEFVLTPDEFCTVPPLADQVGWFDGVPFCAGALKSAVQPPGGGRRVQIERVAAGSLVIGGLNRAAIIQLGQEKCPELLCQPDAEGTCTFQPALALVRSDGTLMEPGGVSVISENVHACSIAGFQFAMPGGCPPTAVAGCSTPGKSLLQIKDNDANGPGDKDKVSWKWLKGPAHAQDDFGSPTASTGTDFCVYADGGTRLIFEANVPPGGTCGDKDCWKLISTKGYKYVDKAKSTAGILKLQMKGGEAGKSNVSVLGKDGNLPLPSLPLASSGDIIVQLSNDANANCWEATFAPGDVIKDTAQKFTAKTG